ncbi:MAG: hypothetical protein EOO10_10335 [Chitinophagaceae bacterium]|nr:MAG: hypothetical protein EOO10_10335 [Chitinophagaceae bacterium]
MKEECNSSERKRRREKIFSQREVDELLREKEIRNQSQYSVLKETYQELLLLKKENATLKEKLAAYESPDDGYRKDWTWVAKIVFAIEKAGKPLRSAEIIEILEKREPHLREHTSKPQYFSAFINLALKNERIKREKRKGERGYYYSI